MDRPDLGSTREALERLFGAFAARDAEAVAACYADEARFEDPLFRLHGEDVRRMWRGLLGRARDFSVGWEVTEAHDGHGRVRWTAQALGPPGKLFGGTGWLLRSARKKAAAGLGLPPRED